MRAWLDNAEEYLAAYVLLLLVLLNFANVVGRYVLKTSMGASSELIVEGLVIISFLGIAPAARRRAHLGMTYFSDKLPPKGRRVLIIFHVLLGCAVYGTIAYYGVDMVALSIRNHRLLPATGIPAWPTTVAIPVAGALALIRSLQAAATEWKEVASQ